MSEEPGGLTYVEGWRVYSGPPQWEATPELRFLSMSRSMDWEQRLQQKWQRGGVSEWRDVPTIAA